jgi:hypothetical protein
VPADTTIGGVNGNATNIVPRQGACRLAADSFELILINAAMPRRLHIVREMEGPLMIGITLTSEQIRNAPPPVRQWIEKEVTAALGLSGPQASPAPPPQETHLVACNAADAEAIFARVQNVLPAVNIFFEFGRPTVSYGDPPLMMYRLLDLMYHARLRDVGQVVACLQMIDGALADLRHDAGGRFCGFDNEGHCFILAQTQESIAALWQKLASGQQGAQQSPDKTLSPAA